MVRYFAIVIALLPAAFAHATLVIAESGDFLGDSSNQAASEILGVLTDPVVQISGSISGALDKVDAWTFTVPPGALLAGINVLSSGFDGSQDWVDLYSDPSTNPVFISGDLLSEGLLAASYPFPVGVGPGTYKLTAISEQSAAYILELVSTFGHSATVPEPSAFALGGLISVFLAACYLVKRRRAA
jgi:hypothetical protein